MTDWFDEEATRIMDAPIQTYTTMHAAIAAALRAAADGARREAVQTVQRMGEKPGEPVWMAGYRSALSDVEDAILLVPLQPDPVAAVRAVMRWWENCGRYTGDHAIDDACAAMAALENKP